MESDSESARLDALRSRAKALFSPEARAQREASLVEAGKILAQSDRYQKDLLRRLGVRTNLENEDEFWLRMWAAARYVGFSTEEFWDLTPRELCAVLDLKVYELELHAGATDSILRPGPCGDATSRPVEAASLEPSQTTAADVGKGAGCGAVSPSAPRKRGPKTDYETAFCVAEVVRRIAADAPWQSKLDDICTELDEQKVKRPKTWKPNGCRSWYECLIAARHLVVEAIRHHLRNADKAAAETIP